MDGKLDPTWSTIGALRGLSGVGVGVGSVGIFRYFAEAYRVLRSGGQFVILSVTSDAELVFPYTCAQDWSFTSELLRVFLFLMKNTDYCYTLSTLNTEILYLKLSVNVQLSKKIPVVPSLPHLARHPTHPTYPYPHPSHSNPASILHICVLLSQQ